MSLRPASGEARSRLVVVAVVAVVVILTRIWLLAVPPTFSDIPAYQHDAAMWGAAGEEGTSFYDLHRAYVISTSEALGHEPPEGTTLIEYPPLALAFVAAVNVGLPSSADPQDPDRLHDYTTRYRLLAFAVDLLVLVTLGLLAGRAGALRPSGADLAMGDRLAPGRLRGRRRGHLLHPLRPPRHLRGRAPAGLPPGAGPRVVGRLAGGAGRGHRLQGLPGRARADLAGRLAAGLRPRRLASRRGAAGPPAGRPDPHPGRDGGGAVRAVRRRAGARRVPVRGLQRPAGGAAGVGRRRRADAAPGRRPASPDHRPLRRVRGRQPPHPGDRVGLAAPDGRRRGRGRPAVPAARRPRPAPARLRRPRRGPPSSPPACRAWSRWPRWPP